MGDVARAAGPGRQRRPPQRRLQYACAAVVAVHSTDTHDQALGRLSPCGSGRTSPSGACGVVGLCRGATHKGPEVRVSVLIWACRNQTPDETLFCFPSQRLVLLAHVAAQARQLAVCLHVPTGAVQAVHGRLHWVVNVQHHLASIGPHRDNMLALRRLAGAAKRLSVEALAVGARTASTRTAAFFSTSATTWHARKNAPSAAAKAALGAVCLPGRLPALLQHTTVSSNTRQRSPFVVVCSAARRVEPTAVLSAPLTASPPFTARRSALPLPRRRRTSCPRGSSLTLQQRGSCCPPA